MPLNRLVVAIAFVIVAVGGATALPHSQARAANAGDFYVSPQGSDAADGLSSQQPLRTIQKALDLAHAGAVIHLARGSYYENPVTKINGTATAPITVEGTDTGFAATGRAATVLYGAGAGRVFTINNSYIRLQGFTINGEPSLRSVAHPTTLAGVTAFKNSVQARVVDSTLVFVGAATTARFLTGDVISDMFLTDAGGTCVRLRDGAHGNTIVNSTIQWCGLYGKYAGAGVYAYHNGEGVYLGTSPKSVSDPMYSDDATSYNVVQHNVISTYGTECLDVKENARNNSFIDNTCSGNTEPLSDYGSNVELRGYNNSVIGNTIRGSLGYGLKLSADGPTNPQGGNVVQSNAFSGDTGSPIRNDQTKAQGSFCGNTFAVSSYLRGASVGSATGACA
jgi:hypothetical protein